MPAAPAIAPYLQRIDAACWYTNFGPLARELEQRLAARHRGLDGATVAVQSVANATLGIELALLALRLPPQSPVLVPALTFSATAAAIVRSGNVPLVCDVDHDSWLLTPAMALAALERTPFAAVVPVCAYGCAQDVEQWDRFAARTGVPVVVDAAGAFHNQARIGRAPVVFSLHATKSLGAGEGGFVASCDPDILAEVRRLSNFGIDVATAAVLSPGTNAKLSEYHAAVALAALDSWSTHSERRIALHLNYLRTLKEYCPEAALQRRPADGVYTILPVLLPPSRLAADVGAALEAQGIESRRWYCPTLAEHPAYSGYPRAGALPMCEALGKRLLGLPFYPAMQPAVVERVCRALREALSGAHR
jgi:dTDP-4-amino-4,6-dideoxygalactose transaminase